MLRTLTTLFMLTSTLVTGQRPPFAGSRPLGYPELVNRTTTPSELADRFGEGTTQKLPIEAYGDRDLIDRLSKLPIDKQPFWFINWQANEELRKNPQSYPQRPNVFVGPVPQSNSQTASSNQEGFRETENFSFQEVPYQIQQSSGNVVLNSNQGVLNNQGFSTNNQGISTYKPEFLAGKPEFLASSQSSNSQGSFSSVPKAQTSSQNINRFVNSNHGLSKPSSGFTNSINGIVLSDTALEYANTEKYSGIQNNDNVSGNSNQFFNSASFTPSSGHSLSQESTSASYIPSSGLSSGQQYTSASYIPSSGHSSGQQYTSASYIPSSGHSSGQQYTSASYIPSSGHSSQQSYGASYGSLSSHSNQQITSVNSRPSINQQIYKIPNHGLTTIKQEFFNQNPGLVTPNIKVPNKSFSSSVTSNFAISNSKPGIDSRFAAQSANHSTSSSSSNKVGDAHNYSFQWNKTYNNTYKYTSNYTTHSVTSVSHNPRPAHNNQEYHYVY